MKPDIKALADQFVAEQELFGFDSGLLVEFYEYVESDCSPDKLLPVEFYRVGGSYGSFSNFSKHPVEIEGTMWPTTEHYFQAQKFSKPDLQELIRLAPAASEAARLGRNRSNVIRWDWEKIKDAVMLRAIRAKVRQHEDVREMLLSTGDRPIIEHTKNDRYWGDGGDGSGKNMLGVILMKVRDELRIQL